MSVEFDVVVVGGGPAGLSAALLLGRARKRTLLCDSGPRRNAAAEHIHGFVTRDGTPPDDFRRIGRAQLKPYPSVETRDAGVESIRGEGGEFEVQLTGGSVVRARRVLLCTGMVDLLPQIDGLRELWGKSIFICPYCHAWEVRDRRFGALVASPEMLDFALLLRSWTADVVLFNQGRFEITPEARERLTRGGVSVETRAVTRIEAGRVFVEGGDSLPIEILFIKPPQKQVALVESLGLALDVNGYLRVDEFSQTSTPGIYAAGDSTSGLQSAIHGAASGYRAAATLNHDVAIEHATAPESSRVRAGTSG